MSADTDFDKAFADSYNEAHELYLESRLIECEEKLRIMLRDPDIPRYPLFKTLVLLGLISGDWYEASYYRLCAEKQWQTLRGWSPEGTNTTFDSQMKALRGDLIILNEALMEDAPFKLDSMNYLGGGTDSENSSIEEGRTGIESLDIDVPVPVVTIQEHHEDDMEMDTEPAEEPTADVKPTEDSTMYIKPAMDVKPAPKPLKVCDFMLIVYKTMSNHKTEAAQPAPDQARHCPAYERRQQRRELHQPTNSRRSCYGF